MPVTLDPSIFFSGGRDTVPPISVGASTMRMHAPAQHAPAHAPEHTQQVVGEETGITPPAKVYMSKLMSWTIGLSWTILDGLLQSLGSERVL